MDKNLDHEFDEYLKAHSEEIVKAIPEFVTRLEKTQFRYGRFSIPTFYKAHFMTPKQERLLKRTCSTLDQVINTAARLYFEEGHLSHVYRVAPEAAELIKVDPGYSKSVIFSRYDGFLEGESLKFVEFNCDSPAGAAYSDQLEDVLLQEKALRPFFEENQIKNMCRAQSILDGLLSAYEEFGGFQTPNIAIVDWRHVRTSPEFRILKDYFESRGYKTTIADPRELNFKSGKLYHKNFHIDIVYRRFVFDELLNRLDEADDLIRAYQKKAFCMVNPLRARLASTKALLSILTNSEYDHFFTDSQNQCKHEHIPWTRRLIDAEDFYGGKKVYLIDFLKDQKDTLILKPAEGYGGKDVAMGCETSDKDWNGVIDKALKGNWVVQEYVNIPIMTVPHVVNGKLDFKYKKHNFNTLVFNGKFSGSFVRLSDESVINVARHGGLMASFPVEYVGDGFGGSV